MKQCAVLFLLLVVVFFGCAERKPIKTGLEGKPLPSFNLLLSDSATYFNTGNIPEGKPVVLYYFSPRCPYCRTQMEDIVNNISSLQDIRFYIFTAWSFGEMKGFYRQYRLDKYPNIVAGVDYANFFENYFKAAGVPYTAIYGKDKKLNEVFVGNIQSKQIRKTTKN